MNKIRTWTKKSAETNKQTKIHDSNLESSVCESTVVSTMLHRCQLLTSLSFYLINVNQLIVYSKSYRNYRAKKKPKLNPSNLPDTHNDARCQLIMSALFKTQYVNKSIKYNAIPIGTIFENLIKCA